MKEVTDPALIERLNSMRSERMNQKSSQQNSGEVTDPKLIEKLNSMRSQRMQQQQPSQQSAPSKETSEPSADRNMQDRILYAQLHQRSPFTPAKDEEGLNIAERIGTTALDYAPYAIGAGGAIRAGGSALAKLAPKGAAKIAEFAAKNPKTAKYLAQGSENALGGAGYGAAMAPEGDVGSSALRSAALSVIPTAGGAAFDPLLRYGAKKYAQSAIPEFTKKATEKLGQLLPVKEYSKKLEDKFLYANKANKANWAGLDKTAESLDKSVPRGPLNGFNSAPYDSYIQGYSNKIKGMEPAIKEPYSQSLDVAEKAKELSPQSFSGAVALRKNINQNMKDYLNKGGTAINPQNYQSKEFLTGLKNNLKNETIAAQEGKVSPEQLAQFKNEWEAANKSHQGLQEFYKTPQASTGVLTPKRQVREAFENLKSGNEIDPAIFGKYLPTLGEKGLKGIQGLKQLEKLLGSKKDAADAAKAYLFSKQINNGANTVDSAAKYAQLSKSQSKYMFGKSDEGRMLEAINKTRLAFGREPEKTLAKIGHGVLGYGLPTAIGYGGSRLAGEDEKQSLLNAALFTGGTKLAKGIAAKTANASRVNRAINFGKNGTTNTGRNLNALTQIYTNPNQRNQ